MTAIPLATNEAERLAAPVDCVGWVVLTTTTGNNGHASYQHSPIYRRLEDAEQIKDAGHRELKPWERDRTRTVQPVCTAFSFGDVLAGNAERWGDYLDRVAAERPMIDAADVNCARAAA